ncbi:MAG: site-specific integrase [Spirochaetaceae bacterium]|nr:site-specific integrase [Spirochaetaceae bacterium]
MDDYRFIERQGRKIQVVFRILPGKEISTGTDCKSEAIKFAERYLQDFDVKKTGKIPTFKEIAYGFYANDKYGYIKQLEKKKKYHRAIHWAEQEGRIQNYWIPKFGSFLISAITAKMIDNWYMDLTDCHGKSKQLADSTKNKILYAGKPIFKMAVREKIIRENPTREITKITEENKPRKPFCDFELAKLFPEDESELLKIWLTRKWISYFLIMRDTGWRPGEIAGLIRINYYPHIGGVYTDQSIEAYSGSVKKKIKTTDNGKAFKIGYLSEATIIQLNKYLEEENPGINDLIFTSTKNTGLKPEVSLKHFKASCKRAGVIIGDRTQYSLRHTFDTKMLEGLDKDTVSVLMGHVAYRPEYDHRSAETLLRQYKGAREKIEQSFKIG